MATLKLCLLFIASNLFCYSLGLQYVPHTVLKHYGVEDPGDALILSPYIKNGQIDQGRSGWMLLLQILVILHLWTARTLSQVKGVGSYPSYSGKYLWIYCSTKY